MAGVAKNQAINILLSVFFNPVVNAARAIAFQIEYAINSFVHNYYTAVRPQITKYYAAGDMKAMLKLVFTTSKISYYLMFVLSMPILLMTSYIVELWLNKLPDHVVIFTRLITVYILIDTLSTPLMTVAHATGRIKLYQALVGTLTICNIPVSYIFLKLDFAPQVTVYVAICISIIALFARLWVVKRLIKFPVLKFIREVLLTVVLTSIIAYILPLLVNHYIIDYSFSKFILLSCICLLSSFLTIYFIGLTKKERMMMQNFANKTLKKACLLWKK
jgi:O-antigen/teichoic acid export membrane protein